MGIDYGEGSRAVSGPGEGVVSVWRAVGPSATSRPDRSMHHVTGFVTPVLFVVFVFFCQLWLWKTLCREQIHRFRLDRP